MPASRCAMSTQRDRGRRTPSMNSFVPSPTTFEEHLATTAWNRTAPGSHRGPDALKRAGAPSTPGVDDPLGLLAQPFDAQPHDVAGAQVERRLLAQADAGGRAGGD